MKRAGFLLVSILALFVLHRSARATTPDTPDNPYARLDPDGVPLAVTQTPDEPLTAAQVEALRQEAIQAERNRSWLMIEYEQQLQIRSKDPAEKNKVPNLYLQLSTNKDLAKLAGLDPIDPADESLPAPSLHATPSPSAKSELALRPESSVPKGVFTPLVSPLSPFSTSATQSYSISIFSSSIPSILAPFPNGNSPANPSPAPTPAPTEHSTAYMDAMDLQTPGMVASKDNSLGDTTTPDLNLDSLPGEALPGETDDQVNAREEASTRAELPHAMDVDQLHLQETARLTVPSMALQNKTATAATDQKQPEAPKAIPVNPEDAPMPVTQQQQLTPVHAPIANPYDILNR